jgi:outer membrane protein assembly factor BamD
MGYEPEVSLLVALFLSLSTPAYAQVGPRNNKELTVEEQYELGLKYTKRGYYTKALEQFNRIRNYHRDDPFAVKAELAIADVYFEQQEWDQARLAYQDFLRMHPRHEDVDYVVYQLGMTAWKKSPKIAARDQAWTRQAVNTWTGFDTRFADSEYVVEVEENLDEARDRLARKEFLVGSFYFDRKAWIAVIGRMEGLIRQYPTSPEVEEALRMLAIAYAENGQTEDAIMTAKRLQADHPDSRSLKKLERKYPELLQ